jgi:hypothetical protein
MATPIGYIGHKPVFGPPRPPEMMMLGTASSAAGVNASDPTATHMPFPSLGPDFFVGFSSGYTPFSSLEPWETSPAHLTCPASSNGWNVEDDSTTFSGSAWSGSSDCGLFDKLPRELRDRIYTDAMEMRLSTHSLGLKEEWETATCVKPELTRRVFLDLMHESIMIFPGKLFE